MCMIRQLAVQLDTAQASDEEKTFEDTQWRKVDEDVVARVRFVNSQGGRTQLRHLIKVEFANLAQNLPNLLEIG